MTLESIERSGVGEREKIAKDYIFYRSRLAYNILSNKRNTYKISLNILFLFFFTFLGKFLSFLNDLHQFMLIFVSFV